MKVCVCVCVRACVRACGVKVFVHLLCIHTAYIFAKIPSIYTIPSSVCRLYQLRGQEPMNYFNTSSSHLENTSYRQHIIADNMHSITLLVFFSILVAHVCRCGWTTPLST